MKHLSEYALIVVDMDGTLYAQPPLRLCMAFELGAHHLLNPRRIGDLSLLREYRALLGEREHAKIDKLAARFKRHPDDVREIVRLWMEERPLKWIPRFRNRSLIARLERLKAAGARVVVFSDYPAEHKTKVIGLRVDGVYCATDARIDAPKPDPKGLEIIATDFGAGPEEMLVIGDRPEKDGACAARFGADFLLHR